MDAFISGISYYLPEKVIDNAELSSMFPEWSVDKISSKTGIAERRVAAENEFAGDMALKAATALFDEYDIDPSTIDFLLYCTQSPDHFLPPTSCIIQKKLGLSINIGSLDFNLGCSGYVYGLSLAKGLIASGSAKNILFITSETYSKFIHPKDKGNQTIFGDAASATLITSKPGFAKIGTFSFGTDGGGAENLIVKNGGVRKRYDKGEGVFEGDDFIKSDSHLYMNGKEIFSFTAEKVPILVADVLLKNGIQKEDIDLFVFHQANKYMLNFIRKKIKIPQDKFYLYMENVGNTVSNTIPIALKHAQEEKKLSANVLLAGFGVGYSWAGVILQIK